MSIAIGIATGAYSSNVTRTRRQDRSLENVLLRVSFGDPFPPSVGDHARHTLERDRLKANSGKETGRLVISK